MRWIKVMLLSCALLSAGCARTVPPSCAGWEKAPKINDPVRLTEAEPRLARWLVATERFAEKIGCRRQWK